MTVSWFIKIHSNLIKNRAVQSQSACRMIETVAKWHNYLLPQDGIRSGNIFHQVSSHIPK